MYLWRRDRGNIGSDAVRRAEVGCFGAVEDRQRAEEVAFSEGLGGLGNETVEKVKSADAIDDVVRRAQDEVTTDDGRILGRDDRAYDEQSSNFRSGWIGISPCTTRLTSRYNLERLQPCLGRCIIGNSPVGLLPLPVEGVVVSLGRNGGCLVALSEPGDAERLVESFGYGFHRLIFGDMDSQGDVAGDGELHPSGAFVEFDEGGVEHFCFVGVALPESGTDLTPAVVIALETGFQHRHCGGEWSRDVLV